MWLICLEQDSLVVLGCCVMQKEFMQFSLEELCLSKGLHFPDVT